MTEADFIFIALGSALCFAAALAGYLAEGGPVSRRERLRRWARRWTFGRW